MRLQTDYVDLYQIHWPDHGTPYEETMEVLDALVLSDDVTKAVKAVTRDIMSPMG